MEGREVEEGGVVVERREVEEVEEARRVESDTDKLKKLKMQSDEIEEKTWWRGSDKV